MSIFVWDTEIEPIRPIVNQNIWYLNPNIENTESLEAETGNRDSTTFDGTLYR